MTHIPKHQRSEVAVVWASLAQKVANQNASLDDFTANDCSKIDFLTPTIRRKPRGTVSRLIIRDRLRRWTEREEMALFDDEAGRALSRVQPAGLPALD
jgi:hypothetical protein